MQGPLGEQGFPGGAERYAFEEDAREVDEIGQAILTGATYGVLFVLGVFLGVLGALEHSWILLNVPVAAIGWLAVLFAVPYGMGRVMGSRMGALTTAVGWGVISAVLATHRSEGDLLIAANTAGYAYLYGGMAAVAVAVLLVPSSGSWLLTPRLGAPPPGDPHGLPR